MIEDYLARRRALAARKDYKAYAQLLMEQSLIEEHFKLANDGTSSIEAINTPLDTLLERYPLSIEGHQTLAGFIEHVANNIEGGPDADLLRVAARKREIADAILAGILSTGDGKTTATAYQVIHPGEEYSLLRHLGLEPVDQSMILGEPGRPVTSSSQLAAYDLINAKTRDGKTVPVYFDISSFFGRPALERDAVDAMEAAADQADTTERQALDAATAATDIAAEALQREKPSPSRTTSGDKTPDGTR